MKTFNMIMDSEKMSEEWRSALEYKDDVENCINYRGIKLMSHTLKSWERRVEEAKRCFVSSSTGSCQESAQMPCLL